MRFIKLKHILALGLLITFSLAAFSISNTHQLRSTFQSEWVQSKPVKTNAYKLFGFNFNSEFSFNNFYANCYKSSLKRYNKNQFIAFQIQQKVSKVITHKHLLDHVYKTSYYTTEIPS